MVNRGFCNIWIISLKLSQVCSIVVCCNLDGRKSDVHVPDIFLIWPGLSELHDQNIPTNNWYQKPKFPWIASFELIKEALIVVPLIILKCNIMNKILSSQSHGATINMGHHEMSDKRIDIGLKKKGWEWIKINKQTYNGSPKASQFPAYKAQNSMHDINLLIGCH